MIDRPIRKNKIGDALRNEKIYLENQCVNISPIINPTTFLILISRNTEIISLRLLVANVEIISQF